MTEEEAMARTKIAYSDKTPLTKRERRIGLTSAKLLVLLDVGSLYQLECFRNTLKLFHNSEEKVLAEQKYKSSSDSLNERLTLGLSIVRDFEVICKDAPGIIREVTAVACFNENQKKIIELHEELV